MYYLPKLFVRFAACALALCSSAVCQKAAIDLSQPPIPQQAGILANTLTATELTVPEKFGQRVIEQFGWPGLVGAAIGGGAQQAANRPKEWGQGWGAFGQRYASSYGGSLSANAFAFGLESLLHEDPRYFPSSEKDFRDRFRNVLLQSFMAKKDDGHPTVAYARLISAFASGFLADTWQPRSTSTVNAALRRGGLHIAGGAGLSFLQEFFPFTRNSYFRRHP